MHSWCGLKAKTSVGRFYWNKIKLISPIDFNIYQAWITYWSSFLSHRWIFIATFHLDPSLSKPKLSLILPCFVLRVAVPQRKNMSTDSVAVFPHHVSFIVFETILTSSFLRPQQQYALISLKLLWFGKYPHCGCLEAPGGVTQSLVPRNPV